MRGSMIDENCYKMKIMMGCLGNYSILCIFNKFPYTSSPNLIASQQLAGKP